MAAGERYALTARLLHWAVALLVSVLFGLGLVMTRGTLSIEPLFTAYQWHKTVGVLVWLLMVFRLSVRLALLGPDLPSTVSPQRQRIARLVHRALYVLLLAMPVSGWLMASASPLVFPISLFGFDVPLLAALQGLPDAARARWFEALKLLHSALALALFALVMLHVGGALSHGGQLRGRMSLWRRPHDA
jgi:cytochrome b561